MTEDLLRVFLDQQGGVSESAWVCPSDRIHSDASSDNFAPGISNSRFSASFGTRMRRPILIAGISPRRTASYANARLMPRMTAASSTVRVRRSPEVGAAPMQEPRVDLPPDM